VFRISTLEHSLGVTPITGNGKRKKKERREEKGKGKLWYVTMIWCVVYSSFIIFNKFLNE